MKAVPGKSIPNMYVGIDDTRVPVIKVILKKTMRGCVIELSESKDYF